MNSQTNILDIQIYKLFKKKNRIIKQSRTFDDTADVVIEKIQLPNSKKSKVE